MLMQEFGLYREVIGHPDGTAFANALYSVVSVSDYAGLSISTD
jgi:hypothetical protein